MGGDNRNEEGVVDGTWDYVVDSVAVVLGLGNDGSQFLSADQTLNVGFCLRRDGSTSASRFGAAKDRIAPHRTNGGIIRVCFAVLKKLVGGIGKQAIFSV